MSVAEIRAELKALIFGRVSFVDGVVPPLVFVISNAVSGVTAATAAGIGSALSITVWRLLRGRKIRFAVAGLFGTVLAAALALRSGSAGDFYVPGIISGSATTLVIVLSPAPAGSGPASFC